MVQDALLCPMAYLVTVTTYYWLDLLDTASYLVHIRMTLLVFVAGVVAALNTQSKLHGKSIADVTFAAARFSLIVAGVVLLFDVSGITPAFDEGVLRSAAAALFVTMLINRLFLRWWYLEGRREHPENFLKVLVIGSGARARRMVQTYRDHTGWQIEVVAMLDPMEERGPEEVEGLRVYRGSHWIREILETHVIDEVVVCLPRSLIGSLQQVVAQCEEQAICLRFMADLYDIESDNVSLQKVGDVPMLTIEPVALDERNLLLKRMFDLLASAVALTLLAPFFALVAAAIKLDSKGPVFFVQRRVGLNKRTFPMIKFRSMREDAEAIMAKIEHLNEAAGPIFKMEDDPRVTRIGKLMRRTSIDELPQLFNVFCGHMSLVGPRPMSMRDVGQFSLAIQRRRFSVRPGLACLREISGRSKLSFDKWLELDLKYIDEWSLRLDFKILIYLIPVVLRGEGAT
ncbi:MAG: sugar transferase [Pseudomonadota bacterium]